MTQLVFDRYYTELKRQLRRGEIPAEKAEQYCTEILSKVYQALQTQGVAATSYELDACAIPIINEEIRKILVPLHLNGYRNLRENPVTETQETSAAENVVEDAVAPEEAKGSEFGTHDVAEIKKETVQLVSNGDVQVYQEGSENELNPELRMEIRRILQQEFQIEPAQVKPVVVVVNVTAPQAAVPQETVPPVELQENVMQAAAQAEDLSQAEEVAEASVQIAETQNVAEPVMVQQETPVQVVPQVKAAAAEAASTREVIESAESFPGFGNTVEVIEFEQGQEISHMLAGSETSTQITDQEPLPELDLDVEKLVQEVEQTEEEKEESRHMGLWVPIIMLLLILLWLTVGMLMSYEIVPAFDLGYEWFNETVFDLF